MKAVREEAIRQETEEERAARESTLWPPNSRIREVVAKMPGDWTKKGAMRVVRREFLGVAADLLKRKTMDVLRGFEEVMFYAKGRMVGEVMKGGVRGKEAWGKIANEMINIDLLESDSDSD